MRVIATRKDREDAGKIMSEKPTYEELEQRFQELEQAESKQKKLEGRKPGPRANAPPIDGGFNKSTY